MRNLAVYGTLRKGQSNYRYLDNPKYIKTIELKGYIMLDFEAYPAVIFTGDSHKITVDLIQVTSKDFRRIKNMELRAGYKLDYCVIGYDLYPIYVYNLEIIESGDWIKYLKQRQESFNIAL